MGVREKQDREQRQHDELRGHVRAATGSWRVDGPVVMEALAELREEVAAASAALARLEAAAARSPGGPAARPTEVEALPEWEEDEGSVRAGARQLARRCRDLVAATAGRLRRRRDPWEDEEPAEAPWLPEAPPAAADRRSRELARNAARARAPLPASAWDAEPAPHRSRGAAPSYLELDDERDLPTAPRRPVARASRESRGQDTALLRGLRARYPRY